MKRKLSAFLVVLCIIFGLSTFTACSNSKDNVITNNEFTVTFNSNGGSEISPFKGTVLETLPTPTKAGFVFDGWYSTADLSGTAQTAPLNLVADISLFAKWKATEHAYGEWVVTTPATCTTTGTRTKTCSVCGEKLTEVIPATGHIFGEWIEMEKERTRECTVCHQKDVVTYTVGLRFEYVNIRGNMVYMLAGIGSATGAICIPKIHDGELVEGIKDSAFSGCTSLTSIIIPSSVTSIGTQAFAGCTSLISIAVDQNNANYQSIDGDLYDKPGTMLLQYAPGKTNFIIPSSATSIGYAAFANCTSLTSIIIPSSVTSIGEMAFSGCTNLSTVTFAEGSMLDSIEWNAFRGCTSLTSIIIPSSVTSIGDSAFSRCTSLTSIIIPSSVTSIGRGAFKDCTNLSIVTFAEGSKLTSIDGFDGCTSLTSIIIPNTVTCIDGGAFSGCTSLTSIIIPSCVTSIEDKAFSGCTNLSAVSFAEGSMLNSIGRYGSKYDDGAFYGCTSLTNIIIPSNVTSIERRAFSGCTNLSTVTFAEGSKLTSINGFDGCTSLTSIFIPSSVNIIGRGAFKGCKNLSTVTFAEGGKLTRIDGEIIDHEVGAFYGCTSLTSIIIPSSVTKINGDAFSGCPALTIYAEATGKPREWVDNWSGHCPVVWNCKTNDLASDGCSYTIIDGVRYSIKYGIQCGEAIVEMQPSRITTAHIAANIIYKGNTYPVTSIKNGVFSACTALTNITVDPNNANYQSIDGTLYDKSGTSLIQYALGNTATSFIIPSSVEWINARAFKGCTNLSTVTFAEGSKLTSIKCYESGGVFEGCTSLTSIIIPSNVTSIEGSAFKGCINLSTVTFAEGSKLTSIDSNDYGGAFSGCISLTSINIPSSVTSIGGDLYNKRGAFSGCTSLTSISIPSSVTSIGKDAFSGCTSLTVYAEATEQPSGWKSDWKSEDCHVVWNCKTNDIADDGYIYTVIDGLRYAIKNGKAMIAMQPSTITTANIVANIIYKGNTYPVTSIGNNAFSSCTNLSTVIFAEGSMLGSIGDDAFNGCTSLTSIIIPSSVTRIGNSVFSACTNLSIVTFAEGSMLGSIGDDAFNGCTSLTSIIIPSSVTVVGGGAFWKCTNLSTVTFAGESKLTSIGGSVFRGCTSLTSIIIPGSVTMGYMAFGGCTSLTVYAEATEQPSGWNIDWNSSNRPVYWFSATAPTGAPATGNGYWRYVNGVPTKW